MPSHRWFRECSALAAAAALGFWAYGAQADTRQVAIVAALATIAASALAIVFVRVASTTSQWIRPLAVFAIIGGEVTLIAGPFSGNSVLALSLSSIGVAFAAFGIAFHKLALIEVSPAFLVGAWILFAEQALNGNPQWYTIPIGVALLAMAEIGRYDRRAHGLSPVAVSLVLIEYAGMVFFVAATLLQTVTNSVAFGLLAVALGATLGVWGAVTRVRRRAVFGAVTVGLAAVLIVAVPVVDAARVASGVGLWLSLAGLGLVAILVAAFVERTITAVRHTVDRIADLTEDWEQVHFHSTPRGPHAGAPPTPTGLHA